ncbi:hypothetical protein HZC32_03210 [Candidatus Woesearchaeota archaeon]|nr:hypothetical protein [Candidatus Woesearchaeota archaeon]
MRKVIIDTNALMAAVEFKLEVFSELAKCCDFKFKTAVLEGTVEELKKIITEQGGKHKAAAKLALAMLQAKDVEVLTSKKNNVDDSLVDYSRNGYLVLTQDLELKRRLTKPYLTIRQRKKIIWVR